MVPGYGFDTNTIVVQFRNIWKEALEETSNNDTRGILPCFVPEIHHTCNTTRLIHSERGGTRSC